MAESNTILRPLPQRAWQITPAPSDPPSPPSPAEEQQEGENQSKAFTKRTRSILNLTSSTLFGIYSPGSADGSAQEVGQVNTPWGAGSMTPATTESPRLPWSEDKRSPIIGLSEHQHLIPTLSHHPRRPVLTGTVIPWVLRSSLLFISGLAYGLMVTYLDDNETLTPVRLEIIHQHTWQYLVFWGLSGVAMGNMLPWFDVLFEAPAAVNWAWDQKQLGMNGTELDRRRESLRRESLRRDSVRRDSVVDSVNREKEVETVWLPAVRGIGVFIGIAFAIRKLPWESTSQAILTLVLVNPVLWYIVDRSRPGFIVSVLAALAGTVTFMMVNLKFVSLSGQSISSRSLPPGGSMTSEVLGVFTWVASVIFCSCVCFRNIGKMLAFQTESY